MAETNPKFWANLFFAAFRRKPNNTTYGYKRNVIQMSNGYRSNMGYLLEKPSQNTVEFDIGDSSLEIVHIRRIRDFLLRDVQAPPDSRIKLIRDGNVPTARIWDWKHNALLFKNPLDPNYSRLSGPERGFIMNNKIRLETERGEETLDPVLWPSAAFSFSCRGIGVRTDIYKQFQEKYGSDNGIPHLANPVTGHASLKMYPADFVPRGFKAVGLFPMHVERHKNVFKGIDLFGALVKSRRCTREEIVSISERLTPVAEQSSNTNFDDGNPVEDDATKNVQIQGNLNNLEKWKRISRNYRPLWSPRNPPTDSNIPGDILRCTLISKDVTEAQMKEEFFKHYILFSIFSQAWRIDERLSSKNLSQSTLSVPWRSWDIYISQRSREISAIPIPNTLEELSDVKNKFDRFLSECFSYYTLIVSEMKSETPLFFHPTSSQLPRMVAVDQVLRSILLDNLWIRMLYPNLHVYMKNRLRPIGGANSSHLTIPSTAAEGDEPTFHSTEKLLVIVRTILEFDSESRQNRVSRQGGIYVDLQTPSNWKIKILNNGITDPEVRRLLKFNTDLKVQFTQNLMYSTNNGDDDGWSCQKKKMLDPDTYFYLYRKEDQEEVSMDLIDKIIARCGTTEN